MDIIRKNYLLTVLFLLLGVLWSCSDERVVNDISNNEKDKLVTFSVKIPGVGIAKNSGPTTYALSQDDENEVKEIAILLFDTDANYTYQPIYSNSNSIKTSPDDNRIKTFTVKVPEGVYSMVVLANFNEALNSVLDNISIGNSKAQVLSKLLLTNSSKWSASAMSSNYISIPMWGETEDVAINSTMLTNIPITLIRMLAKIDISLTTSLAKENFNLQSVRLYNYNNQGQIAPNQSSWDKEALVVSSTSIPLSAHKISDPLLYDGSSITLDKEADNRGVSCIDEIYTFETDAGTASTSLINTCLVIGGTFGENSQTTYYRIDFANKTGATSSYLPLLRNHNYKVNITNVKGSGLPTPEDAFKSHPVNIEASVINWSDTQIQDITFDGQYMMGVSQGEFTFSREMHNTSSEDNKLFITTDVPSGWNVDKIIDEYCLDINWLSISTKTGASGSTTKTQLLMSENTTGSTRIGYIHLSAARLTYIVKITQLATSKGIHITDIDNNPINSLKFAAKRDIQPQQQQFKLNWDVTSSLSFISTSTGNAFSFTTDDIYENIPINGTLSDPLGIKTYTIRPPAISSADLKTNPFYERNSVLIYSIPNGKSVIYKTFTLRQYAYNMIPVVADYYKMDGSQQSFGVRSNTPFTVSVKSNPDDLITLQTLSGDANTTELGSRVYFDIKDDLVDNPTHFQKDVVVTIKSPEGLFPDTDIMLNCISYPIQPESNTYIVAPNSMGILIPVSRANKSMLNVQLKENETFTADLVWTDNENGVNANSNIKLVTASGSGPLGYVLVKPGSQEGNAVVAIKNDAGKILWSWHIWVTNFIPTPIGKSMFMDRNLGALSNTPGEVSTKGMLYQWGRKDPFPSSPEVTVSYEEPTLYTATGTTKILYDSNPERLNFVNSVSKPTTYYHSRDIQWVSSGDWYTYHNDLKNNALWGGGSNKTVYDPCPDGWRVPSYNAWKDLTENFSWSNYGRTNESEGGYFPAAGKRYYKTFITEERISKGYYWSATILTSDPVVLEFSDSDVSSGYDLNKSFRANGYSVRCVKE